MAFQKHKASQHTSELLKRLKAFTKRSFAAVFSSDNEEKGAADQDHFMRDAVLQELEKEPSPSRDTSPDNVTPYREPPTSARPLLVNCTREQVPPSQNDPKNMRLWSVRGRCFLEFPSTNS